MGSPLFTGSHGFVFHAREGNLLPQAFFLRQSPQTPELPAIRQSPPAQLPAAANHSPNPYLSLPQALCLPQATNGGPPGPRGKPRRVSDANPPITEEATFKSGREVLFRRVLRPAAPPWARLALCHGYGEHSGRHLPFLRWLARPWPPWATTSAGRHRWWLRPGCCSASPGGSWLSTSAGRRKLRAACAERACG